MKTQQLVQTQANVIRITSVSAGDVYKRFDDSYNDRVYYGVVTSVHNDGESTIIQSLEYSCRYGSLDVSIKVINGTKEYTLFPCDPSELEFEFDKLISKKQKDLNEYEDKVERTKMEIKAIEELKTGEKQKSLKMMSYAEMSQDEYRSKKALLQREIM